MNLNDSFSAVEKDVKRIRFLENAVEEKNEKRAELTAEAIELRKKNGSVASSDVDIAIYQINAKISKLQSEMAELKASVKKIKNNAAQILTETYVFDKNRSAMLMKELYGDKMFLTDDKTEGGMLGDCAVISSVTTSDKRLSGRTAKLFKAGLKTSAGKIIARPEIEVFRYDSKAEEGMVRAETDEIREEIKVVKDNKFNNYVYEIFADKRKNIAFIALLTGLCAFFAVAFCLGVGRDAASAAAYTLFDCCLAVSLVIPLAAALFKAKRGGFADFVPIASFALGVEVLILSITCSYGLQAYFAAIIMIVAGGSFFALRCMFSKGEGECSDIVLPSGGMIGLLSGFCYVAFAKSFADGSLEARFICTFAIIFAVLFLALGGVRFVFMPDKKANFIDGLVSATGIACLTVALSHYVFGAPIITGSGLFWQIWGSVAVSAEIVGIGLGKCKD